jgi:hypothetical protein
MNECFFSTESAEFLVMRDRDMVPRYCVVGGGADFPPK